MKSETGNGGDDGPHGSAENILFSPFGAQAPTPSDSHVGRPKIEPFSQESSGIVSVRETVTGINFSSRSSRPPDFVFSAHKRKGARDIKTSIIDVSDLVTKGNETDREIRSEKEKPTGEFFLPNAFFASDRENHALTVSFTLTPAENGTLQIENPDIQLSELQLIEKRTAQIEEHQYPDLRELAAQLADRKTTIGHKPSATKRKPVSSPFIDLSNNLYDITDEVAAKYCMAHEIPTIYKYRNPESNQWEYNVTPYISDQPLLAPLAQPKKSYAAIINARNIIAYKQGEPFPHTAAELAELAGEFNDHAKQDNENKSRIIQKQRERTRIANLSSDELRGMSVEDFRTLSTEILRGTIIPSDQRIHTELARRMSEGRAHPNDLYDVLFTAANPNGEYDELQDQAISTLYRYPHYADKLLKIFKSRTNSSVKEKTVTSEVGGRERFDTVITLKDDDIVIHSKVFRTRDPEQSRNLARANILSQLIGTPSDLDAELIRRAGKAQTIASPVSSQQELGEDKIHLRNLREHCDSNGFKIDLAQVTFYPGSETYSTRVAIKIGDIVIAKESSGNTQHQTERQATKRLFTQLNGPKTEGIDFPEDVAASITDLARAQNIPEPVTKIAYTTNPQGQRLTNCVISVEGLDHLCFVGTDTDAQAAQSKALKSMYTALSNRARAENS